MASMFKPSIQGDGINVAFFQQLWQKNRNENRSSNKSQSVRHRFTTAIPQRIPLRLPDTVVFQLGQPLQWYFTSERRGEGPSILRKRRQNVNVEKIEEVFLKRARASNKGFLHENDIVAYFIASNECTLRNRKNVQQRSNDEHSHEDSERLPNQNGCAQLEKKSICDIEFFNEKELREFLSNRRKNQSGILQRFIEPSGGGTHNSQIRAICTPKMCVLERRKTKQDLHDTRFGLYERAVTFEGPEVFSTALPLRGEMLSGKLRAICETVLDYISKDIYITEKCKSDIRMVLHLKVDSSERIWLLYSSSVRNLTSLNQSFPSMNASSPSDGSETTALNLQNVIKFAPKVKLSQIANHDPDVKVSNEHSYLFCPSCGSVQCGETFHPVPYKTLVTHFEQVMALSNHQSWPPSKDIIDSAGGVGFGTITYLNNARKNEDVNATEDDYIIPPVIRYFHKRLKVEGYRRYRADPLFLHKKCNLCENCFLTYANLVSSCFQIKLPINLDSELKSLRTVVHDESKSHYQNLQAQDNIGRFRTRKGSLMDNMKQIESFGSEILLPSPSLPSAIIEPPIEHNQEDLEQLMPLPYKTIESPSQPLQHLLEMYEAMERSQTKVDRVKSNKVKRINPYEVPLTLVDTAAKYKKKSKRTTSNEGETTTMPKVMTSEDTSLDGNQMKQEERDILLLSKVLKEYDLVNKMSTKV